jgi:heterodisulfide reductase subunit A
MKNVLVIGGGVAGIQASLDLADCGFKVYLVEKEPSIGGRMAQLDKTFPTNDCSICILAPKMMDCFRHENISILSFSEVTSVEGGAGDFHVKVLRKARYVDEDKCTGCGLCTEACRLGKRYPNKFEMNLGKRSAIYIPFVQAVPLVYLIDPEHCLMITRGKCGKSPLCIDACGRGAIDFDQKDEEIELNVGAIIVSTGFDPFEPYELREYGYGRYDNVIIALQYERLICAAGPTGGHLKRLSPDGREPKRIAWIQCVGARDERNSPYCCSVCCMHATKEAMLAREHYADIETYIFSVDIRAFGKGFQEYVERGKKDYGIKYIRSRPGEISETDNGDLIIWYNDPSEGVKGLEVDLVVLSTALIPSKGAKKLADILGVELGGYDFFKVAHPLYAPMDTTKEGIFVCGYAQSPKDIPESVAQASGAASRAAETMEMNV